MTRDEFAVRWRTRLAEWARVGALVDGAKLYEEVLADFEAVTRAEDNGELSLSEAAAESGYSSDHLRRLHRLGKLPASRKGRNLFFRTGDLPRKPTASGLSPYDPIADARRVTSRLARATKRFWGVPSASLYRSDRTCTGNSPRIAPLAIGPYPDVKAPSVPTQVIQGGSQ